MIRFNISIKTFRTVSPFLSFKGLPHAYLVKTSMSHNTFLTFLFFEDNDSVSAKSELIFYNYLKLFFKIILNNNFS